MAGLGENLKSKEIDKKTGIIKNPSNTSVSIPVSGFPVDLWNIWNRQCERNYHSIRWTKMWTDHIKAQAYDLLVKSQFLIVEKNTTQESEEKVEKLGLLNPENEVEEHG